jgi:hypothetical protein
MARPLSILAVALALVVGCAGAAPQTHLALTGNVPDASVTIDDQDVGTMKHVTKHGVALPPGTHRLTVEKQGYFPFDKLIESNGKTLSLKVELEPIPD